MRLGILLQNNRLSDSDVAVIKKSVDHIRGDNQCILVVHWLSPLRWRLKELGYDYLLLISLASIVLDKNKEVIENAKYVLAYDSNVKNFKEVTAMHIQGLSDVMLVNVPNISSSDVKIYNISAYIK